MAPAPHVDGDPFWVWPDRADRGPLPGAAGRMRRPTPAATVASSCRCPCGWPSDGDHMLTRW